MTPSACFCSSHCPLSGFHDPGCCAKTTCDCWRHRPGEHRGSVMPERMASLDPSFLDALSAPVPEEALREKLQGFPEEMRPRVLQHLGGRK